MKPFYLIRVSIGLLFIWCLFNCKDDDISRVSFVEVETGEIFKESKNEVILSGTIIGLINDGEVNILEYGHVYSDTVLVPTLLNGIQEEAKLSEEETFQNGVFTTGIEGLDPGKYYYRPYVRVHKNILNTFDTIYPLNTIINEFNVPQFNVIIDSKIIINGATIEVKGKVTDNLERISYGHVWSRNPNLLDIENTSADLDFTSTESSGIPQDPFEFTSEIPNLACHKSDSVYIRAYAFQKPIGDTVYSDRFAFLFEDYMFWDERGIESSLKPPPRYGGISFEFDGYGYVGLGMGTGLNNPLSDLWRYDPNKDEWSDTSEMVANLTNLTKLTFASTFKVGDRIFIGFGSNGVEAVSDVWELINGKFELESNLSNKIPARHSAFSFVIKNNVYIGGGGRNGDILVDDCDILGDLWRIDVINLSINRVFPGPEIYPIDSPTESISDFDCNGENTLLNKCIEVCDGIVCNNTINYCEVRIVGERCVNCMEICDTIPNCMNTLDNGENYASIAKPNIINGGTFDQDSPDIGYLLKKYGAIAYSDDTCGYIFFGKSISDVSNEFKVYDYYLKFTPAQADTTLELLPFASFNGQQERLYPFTFTIGDHFYFGGGIDVTGINAIDPEMLSLDFWEFTLAEGFVSRPSCGFGGFAMGAGFALKTQFLDQYRGCMGLGREKAGGDGLTNKMFTYIHDCQ